MPLDFDQTSTESPFGLVAILDALGASTFSRQEADLFLASRDLVLTATQQKAERRLPKLGAAELKRFVFQDTVVLAYVTGHAPTIDEIHAFCHVLRAFQMLSLRNRLLFRGAFAIGEFYRVADDTNTVMGPAVSDAAGWYTQADWFGTLATPRASIYIQARLEGADSALDNVLVEYPVPLREPLRDGQRTITLKAINWPRAFFVRGLRPPGKARTKAMLLDLLAEHRIPVDAQSKYLNAVSFFDRIRAEQKLGSRSGRKSRIGG